MTDPVEQAETPNFYDFAVSTLGSYVCRRCGALIYLSDQAKQRHDEWHAALLDLAEGPS